MERLHLYFDVGELERLGSSPSLSHALREWTRTHGPVTWNHWQRGFNTIRRNGQFPDADVPLQVNPTAWSRDLWQSTNEEVHGEDWRERLVPDPGSRVASRSEILGRAVGAPVRTGSVYRVPPPATGDTARGAPAAAVSAGSANRAPTVAADETTEAAAAAPVSAGSAYRAPAVARCERMRAAAALEVAGSALQVSAAAHRSRPISDVGVSRVVNPDPRCTISVAGVPSTNRGWGLQPIERDQTRDLWQSTNEEVHGEDWRERLVPDPGSRVASRSEIWGRAVGAPVRTGSVYRVPPPANGDTARGSQAAAVSAGSAI